MSTVEELQARIDELEAEVARLRRHFADLLRAFQTTHELTAEQRRAIRRKLAAQARAAKPKGKGRGSVRTDQTRRKLNQESKS